MKTQVTHTVITELTDKNFKRFSTGKAKITVPVLDGVWVDAWVNPKLDEKVNFAVGDIVMIVSAKTKTEDNEYNGQTRKQHSFFFPDIVPIKRGEGGLGASTSNTVVSGDFGGSPMDISEDDLPF